MGMHQGSVLSPFLLSLVIDVVTGVTRGGIKRVAVKYNIMYDFFR